MKKFNNILAPKGDPHKRFVDEMVTSPEDPCFSIPSNLQPEKRSNKTKTNYGTSKIPELSRSFSKINGREKISQ